ncbi:MAG TPA: ATP-binding protein [Tepidisphaeraceae bacterium]|jgi:signal transduction histidine kinase|nr:ATP-binding protein [Tepidisphaeraceae bacterium]
MFQWLRNLRISLAAKCQILFGAAVVLIIGAALYVPWKRMDDLILMVNLQTAEGLASQAKLEHVAREEQTLRTRPTTEPASLQDIPMLASGFFEPRLIPIHPPKSMPLGRFEVGALGYFWTHPAESHYARTYRLDDSDRYRLAMPLYATDQPSCIKCHAGTADPIASTRPLPAAESTLAAERKLLGIVVTDIPSQVNENQLFLNRAFILMAGVIAGTLATGVLYIITTRLILQPVRVLQETAEKVSQGDLNIRSDISTGDEFEQLSNTFNTMLTNLKSSDDQLRTINKALDLKLGQLAETNVALYESNRLKSEFLANVSHELRTPLNSILGFADLLRENADPKAARYVQNILTSGRNLLDLINDLLDLAKIEAGRMDVRSEPLPLADLFEGLINLLKPLAEAKELAIASTVSLDVPILQTDPAKLQQVLYNLLSNAIKFSPVAGRIDLTAQTEGAERVRVTVKDQGPGIESEKHEVIFEKFRQIDGSVTREHSGTGLGLAISRELVALLGGTIGVDSVQGQGASFWVILPIKTQPGQRDVREKLILS